MDETLRKEEPSKARKMPCMRQNCIQGIIQHVQSVIRVGKLHGGGRNGLGIRRSTKFLNVKRKLIPGNGNHAHEFM